MNNSHIHPRYPQLTTDGKLHHLLSLDGLKEHHLVDLFDLAKSFIDPNTDQIIKVPLLRGKTIVNLFFEPSTRTRTTFELAEIKLSADVVNLDIETSAAKKGESLLDTLHNLQAMQADMFVIRHQDSGSVEYFARHVDPHVHVMNAGDGWHAHPTQALLDMFTIRELKGDIHDMTIAIMGDIKHSRVARSQIQALSILGAREIRVIGPRTLLPDFPQALGVHAYTDAEEGISGADVVIALRLQKERMQGGLIPSTREFFNTYGLTRERLALAKPDAIVMHPGPMNRNVEIASGVADSDRAVILQQVTYGIAIRMAVMSRLLGGSR